MTETASLFQLVTAPLPEPHRFPAESVNVPATDGRPSQTERTCLRCKCVKITVHLPGGSIRREWRRSGESVQLPDEFRPQCTGAADGR